MHDREADGTQGGMLRRDLLDHFLPILYSGQKKIAAGVTFLPGMALHRQTADSELAPGGL